MHIHSHYLHNLHTVYMRLGLMGRPVEHEMIHDFEMRAHSGISSVFYIDYSNQTFTI